MTRRLLLVILAACAAATLLPAPAASALPLIAGPRILMLGDSITWQACGGELERFTDGAPQYLRDRDGGCYGWSGATTADMAFMVQGGRFQSNGPGQPHPVFLDRGMSDIWNLREAMDRADVLVVGLGTNDSNRMVGCGTSKVTPWPVQIDNAPGSGPNPPPCQLTIQQFRDHLNYFAWLAGGKPIFWFDVAVTNTADPAYPHMADINDAIWGTASRWPNFHPIAWNRAVTAHPEYLRDGVHLSDSGGAARYNTLVAALRGCGYR